MASACPPPAFPIHHDSIPYTHPSTSLQTLDIWLPRPLSNSSPAGQVWIVYLCQLIPEMLCNPSDSLIRYVHGGAWRDPAQTSSCVRSTLSHITTDSTVSRIAGVASLNYRLSPHTSHPTNPSSPDDPSRNNRHPDHVRDIERALAYLEQEHAVGMKQGGYEWIGVGHSCGATLLLQYVAGIGLKSAHWSKEEAMGGPRSLVLIEGIYDIPRFLLNHEPPRCSPEIARMYKDMIQGAFGSDSRIVGAYASHYTAVSPTSGEYRSKGKYTIIAQSPEDELVEQEQRDVMLERLIECGWTQDIKDLALGQVVEVRKLSGTHDHIWEDGSQVAELIALAAERVVRAGPTPS